MSEKIKVLYIGGSHRSGSTLIERILGHANGFFSAGELKSAWNLGFPDRGICGCGSPFGECEIWGEVIREAFGPDWAGRGISGEGVRLANSLSRYRKHLLPGSGEKLDKFKREYLHPLYSAISGVTGGSTVIDASNLAWHLYLLSKCDFIDLHLLHLVRDSRAVAFSYKRKRKVIRADGTEVYMPVYSSVTSAKLWAINNAWTWKIGRGLPEGRYLRMNYEDFCRRPREATGEILAFAGGDPGDLGMFSAEREVTLGMGHSILGNPMKEQKGGIPIRTDDEWMEKLSAWDRAVVTGMTWPLLRMLG